MLVGTATAYACYRIKLGRTLPPGWLDLGFLCLEAVLFASSRDTLKNYYRRCEQLLGGPRHRRH